MPTCSCELILAKLLLGNTIYNRVSNILSNKLQILHVQSRNPGYYRKIIPTREGEGIEPAGEGEGIEPAGEDEGIEPAGEGEGINLLGRVRV